MRVANSGRYRALFNQYCHAAATLLARNNTASEQASDCLLCGTTALRLIVSRGAEYCDQTVCLCVYLSLSVSIQISVTAGPIGTKFCVQIPFGRCLVLLRRHCATVCTSGFMGDVTFSRNGRDAERRRLTMKGVPIPGGPAESDVYECMC